MSFFFFSKSTDLPRQLSLISHISKKRLLSFDSLHDYFPEKFLKITYVLHPSHHLAKKRKSHLVQQGLYQLLWLNSDTLLLDSLL